MAKYKRYNETRQPSLFDIDDDTDLVLNLPSQEQRPVAETNAEGDIAENSETKEHKFLRFISFGSGSSGNCSYVGTDEGGILIDAGVDTKKVMESLKDYGIKPEDIKGVCITHDHGDHVRYAYNIVRKYKHIHIFCTNRALNGMLRRHNISRNIKEKHVAIYKEIPFTIAGLPLRLTAFEVPHDGTDNAGFFIECDDLRFAIATDIGHINERAEFYISQAQFVMLESNYDSKMLATGPYPEYLKKRIFDDNGHLDNEDAARFIAKIYRPELKYVFLCHLSKDNNTPEKAREAICTQLSALGITPGFGEDSISDRMAPMQLVALPRFDTSRCYTLRP